LSPIVPALWGPRISSQNSDGVDIARSATLVHPISLRLALHDIGLSMAERRSSSPAVGTAPKTVTVTAARPQVEAPAASDEASTRALVSVLDLPGDEAFNPDQAKIVASWIAEARRAGDWSQPRLDLLRRIARDRRLRSPTLIDQVFERNPKVAAALMGDILDRIDDEGIGRDYTVPRQVAYTFPRLPAGFLLPYAARIQALLAKGGAVREILLPAAGRLGADPSPLLLPFDDDRKSYGVERFARVKGACFADKRWAAALIEPLRAHLDQARNLDQRKAVLSTLANLGDRDFVAARIAADGRPQEARLLERIDKTLANPRYPANALCGAATF